MVRDALAASAVDGRRGSRRGIWDYKTRRTSRNSVWWRAFQGLQCRPVLAGPRGLDYHRQIRGYMEGSRPRDMRFDNCWWNFLPLAAQGGQVLPTQVDC